MLRHVLIVAAGLLISIQGLAQGCVPDQNITEAGFHPKSLSIANVGEAYKEVLQIRVFEDTSVIINGNPIVAIIDSINVVDIKGLPSSFYYTCSRKNCSFIPDSTGCSTLEGTAQASDVGDHLLEIEIEVFAKIFGTISTSQKDTVRQFTLVVDDPSSAGQLNKGQLKIYPNPSNGSITISPLKRRISKVTCFNSIGEIVDYQFVEGRLELEKTTPGFYTVKVDFDDGTSISDKLLIQAN